MALVTIPDQEVVARVNGEEISTSAYKDELVRALYSITAQYGVDWNDPSSRSPLPSFQEQVLDQIIDRYLLHDLAAEEGVTADPLAIENEIIRLKTQIVEDENIPDWKSFLDMNHLTEDIVRSLVAETLLAEALAENHGGSKFAEHVWASHILVDTAETGQEVLDKLEAGEEFGALAAEYSTDPGSKDQGGDLGWFPAGRMVPEFEAAAFGLEPGEISGLVETDFGYHIIQVHEKEEQEMDPAVYAQVQSRQFQEWFGAQHDEADIERLYTFQDAEDSE